MPHKPIPKGPVQTSGGSCTPHPRSQSRRDRSPPAWFHRTSDLLLPSRLRAFAFNHVCLVLEHDRPQDAASQGGQGVDEFLVVAAVAVEAADGAAGAGELG